MSARFSAYSFVDRISALVPGRSARGHFAIPRDLEAFSPCLVAEAIGQLAAWAAMEWMDFQRRPLAALAGEVRFITGAAPGDLLDLEVEIDSLDTTAVTYRGAAAVAGVPRVKLADCLGAMQAMDDFDDPDAARRHFALLRGAGAVVGRFRPIDPLATSVRSIEVGHRLNAALTAPAAAPFFEDHFPRKPVLPATLLVDTQVRLALQIFEPGGRSLRPTALRNLKQRAFILPGQSIDLDAEVRSEADRFITVALTATGAGRRVATARLEMERAS